MLLKILALISLPIIMGCTSKSPKELDHKAQLYFSQGTQNILDREYTEALTNLLKAVEIAPDHSEIHNNLGMAYYLKGKKDKALEHFSRSLELNPKNTDALGNIASIELEYGNLKKAEGHYLKMLDDLTYNKNSMTYFNLGIIKSRENNMVMAETYFQKSIQEDDNYCPAHLQLGLISFKRKSFNDALKYFKDAGMGICTQDPLPTYHQFLTYIEMKNFPMAKLKLSELENMKLSRELSNMLLVNTQRMQIKENEFKAENNYNKSLNKAPEF